MTMLVSQTHVPAILLGFLPFCIIAKCDTLENLRAWYYGSVSFANTVM